MKIKRIVRTPFLRRLRKNLRIILKQAYLAESGRLVSLSRLYINRQADDKLTRSQRDRKRDLIKQERELTEAYYNSILECTFGPSGYPLCKSAMCDSPFDELDGDRVWVPWLGGWICMNCYDYLCKKEKSQPVETPQEYIDEAKKIARLLEKKMKNDGLL